MVLYNKMNVAKPYGLINLGNSCYINSILQLLFVCKDLTKTILNIEPENNTIVISYQNLLEILLEQNKKKNKSIRPRNFVNMFRKKFNNMSINQEDAGEAIIFLLELLHNETIVDFTQRHRDAIIDNMRFNDKIKRECVEQLDIMLKKDYSMMTDIFSGQSLTTVKCNKCKKENNRMEIYKTLEIAINNVDNLSTAINKHFEPELLEDYKCDGCSERNTCYKSSALLSVPKYLIIILKRFDYSGNKIHKKVSFSELLHFKNVLLKDDINSQTIDLYKLKGVVNHNGGRSSGGHYYANIKTDKWYLCDDSSVIPHKDIKRIFSKEAYILFYERYEH